MILTRDFFDMNEDSGLVGIRGSKITRRFSCGTTLFEDQSSKS